MAPRRSVIDDLNAGPDPEEPERDDDARAAADAGDEDDLDPDPPEEEEEDAPEEEGDEQPAGDEPSDDPPIAARRPARQQGRGDRDYGGLRARARTAEERAHQLELENARLRNGGGGRTNEPEPRAVREARLAAMEPAERLEFRMEEMRSEFQTQRDYDRFRDADRRDRDGYRSLSRENPTYKRYEGEVERRLDLLRAQGQNAPRESILRYILGERVLTNRGSPRVKQQRDAAQRRVASQTTTSPKGRGERGGRVGSKSADLEKRLENMPI